MKIGYDEFARIVYDSRYWEDGVEDGVEDLYQEWMGYFDGSDVTYYYDNASWRSEGDWKDFLLSIREAEQSLRMEMIRRAIEL